MATAEDYEARIRFEIAGERVAIAYLKSDQAELEAALHEREKNVKRDALARVENEQAEKLHAVNVRVAEQVVRVKVSYDEAAPTPEALDAALSYFGADSSLWAHTYACMSKPEAERALVKLHAQATKSEAELAEEAAQKAALASLISAQRYADIEQEQAQR